MPETTPPRWDLSNVYPGLDSPEFLAGTNQRESMLTEMEALLTSLESLDDKSDAELVADRINHLLTEIQKLLLLENTLGAFIHSFVSTDSFNKDAMRKQSEFERESVRSDKLETRLRAWVGKIAPLLPKITAAPGPAHEHAFWLKEVAEQSRYLMSQPEEALAA